MQRDELIKTLAGQVLSIEEAIIKGKLALATLTEAVAGADGREAMAERVAEVLEDPDKMTTLAVVFQDDREAWDAAILRMKAIKGASQVVSRWEKAVKRMRLPLRIAEEDEGHEAPEGVPDGWEVPEGYYMDDKGVRIPTLDGDRQLTSKPLWVVGRMVDVDDGSCLVRLAWPGWGMRLRQEIVGRSKVADARALLELADAGAPVTSANSRELTSYIDAATARNEGHLPLQFVVKRCGWVRGGFMLGRSWLGATDKQVSLHVEGGEAQLADALGRRGTWQGWCDTVRHIQHLAPPWLSIYASVASVLLSFLDMREGCVLDFSGETSHGKTTTMRLGISVWGRPDEHGLLGTWKATPVGITERASFLHHLPVFLDDTKHSESDKEPGKKVRDTIYQHTSGRDKDRGKRDGGMRETKTWLSWLVSTGEQPATSFSQDPGARARTLAVRGSPIDSRDTAEAITLGVRDNYGHLGRKVIDFLLEPGRREQVQAWFAASKAQHLATLANEGTVAGRLVEAVASLDVAAKICLDLGVPAPDCDPIEVAVEAARGSSQEADRPAAALRFIYELAVTNSTHFWGRHVMDPRDGEPAIPPGGWWGRWDKDDAARKWRYLAVVPSWLKARLKAGGFDVDGTIERWVERGWLDRDGKNRTQPVRVDGSPVRCICIHRQVLLDVAGVE